MSGKNQAEQQSSCDQRGMNGAEPELWSVASRTALI
jgi:hypothetical protein